MMSVLSFKTYWVRAAVLFSILSASVGAVGGGGENPKAGGLQKSEVVHLRGRVVCLAEEMNRLYQTNLPTPHDHLYGFKTNEGIFYTLVRTKTAEALFSDKRVQERELIVEGRILPNTQILDATPVGSVHNGKLYDLYYYCTVCAIKSVVPGICMCCQQPVEFVEKPVGE